MKPLRRRAPLLALLTAAALLVACERRPDFELEKAHVELARALDRTPPQIAIYSDGRDPKMDDEWIVEFRADGLASFMQARFKGRKDRWELLDLRDRPDGDRETPWIPVAQYMGRLQGEGLQKAADTEATLRQLAQFVEIHAARKGGRFPSGDINRIKQLVLEDGTIEPGEWHHDVDAWQQPIFYHAAADGSSYILVSPGADGAFGVSTDEYVSNTERGLEQYGGPSSDLNADIIIASGTVVQRHAP